MAQYAMIKKRTEHPVICLMGPTGSGKTRLAIELVKYFPVEIVSVDSAMVYCDMNIGTAKPTIEELKYAPHRLIDINDPAIPYSAGQFYQDVLREITAIRHLGRIPLLVGGTMLYFKWLQQGYDELPSTDLMIREKISARGLALGWPALHQELMLIDEKAAIQIHKNDAQRIQRALAIYYSSGRTSSEWYALQSKQSPLQNVLQIILAPAQRSLLHQRIELRFDAMIKQGFIDEVQALFARPDLHAELPSIKTVGYRQIWSYLNGEYDAATLRTKAIVATRQLARRQLTWLRRWQNAQWFDSENSEVTTQVVTACQQFLQGF